jgi:hypothetical protein
MFDILNYTTIKYSLMYKSSHQIVKGDVRRIGPRI